MCIDPHPRGDGNDDNSTEASTAAGAAAEPVVNSETATAATNNEAEVDGALPNQQPPPPPSQPSTAFHHFLHDALGEASARRATAAATAAERVRQGQEMKVEGQRMVQGGETLVRRGGMAGLMAEFEHESFVRTHGTVTGRILEFGGIRGGGGGGTWGGFSFQSSLSGPRFVKPELHGSEIRRLACGGTTKLAALTTTGECFTWQRGGEPVTSLHKNPEDDGILQVALSKQVALLLSGTNKLYAGLLAGTSALVPVAVDEEDEVIGISSGLTSDALMAWTKKGVLVLFVPKLRGIEPGSDFTTTGVVPWPLGGDGQNYYMQKLTPIPGRLDPGTRIASVAAGGKSVYVAFLDALGRGKVYSAGSNEYGQLGHGSTDSADDHPMTVIQALKDASIAQLAAGNSHVLALTLDKSKLYAWGRSDLGQTCCGMGRSVQIPTLVPLGGLSFVGRVVDIAAGAEHSIAKTNAGEIYVWGSNAFGQLGHDRGLCNSICAPVKLETKLAGSTEPVKVVQMVGGVDTTLFLVSSPHGPQEQHHTRGVGDEGTADSAHGSAGPGSGENEAATSEGSGSTPPPVSSSSTYSRSTATATPGSFSFGNATANGFTFVGGTASTGSVFGSTPAPSFSFGVPSPVASTVFGGGSAAAGAATPAFTAYDPFSTAASSFFGASPAPFGASSRPTAPAFGTGSMRSDVDSNGKNTKPTV